LIFFTHLEYLPAKVTEEELSVLSIEHYSGPLGTITEILFEERGLLPDLRQLPEGLFLC
jgi:hypothetical protein